jgi:hypothetical protein
MALDTKAKRASVPGVGRPWYRTKQPASNSQAWRIASGNAYGGNSLGTIIRDTGCIVATAVYQGGSVKGSMYHGGPKVKDVYQGGSVEQQGGCEDV